MAPFRSGGRDGRLRDLPTARMSCGFGAARGGARRRREPHAACMLHTHMSLRYDVEYNTH
jgi:hypothetical protein